ncbi:MAG: primosomal replication protein N [Betaproteobacteria bacterium]|nr:primosomal replication protein N [Betaproteobacteria bacterium]NBU49259.1 primosomal replication protein N [Betaproteobacteria bacterium]
MTSAAPEAQPGTNRLGLSGVIKERSALRYTPAGLPAVDLVIDHQSVVQEEGTPRKVTMDCKAVCIGTLAIKAQQLAMSEPVVFHGFLAPARNGRGVVFHITSLKRLNEPGTD